MTKQDLFPTSSPFRGRLPRVRSETFRVRFSGRIRDRIFDPRSHEFVTTTEKKIPKMDFSLDNPSLQFACFNVVLKRWQVVFVFEEFPLWVCKKIVPQSPQDYCFYTAVNVPSIAMKVRRDHGLL